MAADETRTPPAAYADLRRMADAPRHDVLGELVGVNQGELADLLAERDRYRKALEAIADGAEGDVRLGRIEMARIAHEAVS